jgi:ABC-type multidrug transport system permease subunit
MNFDFGMKHSIFFFLIMLFIDIYAIALYCMLSVFCNNRSNLWSVAVCIVLPMSLLSGTFVQFDKMPVILQKIGNFFPKRWVCIAIEKVQQGKGFEGAFPACAGLILISAVFFAIAIIRGKNLSTSSANSVD